MLGSGRRRSARILFALSFSGFKRLTTADEFAKCVRHVGWIENGDNLKILILMDLRL